MSEPIYLYVSPRLADELRTWAEDETSCWPEDIVYQMDLADLRVQIDAALAAREVQP